MNRYAHRWRETYENRINGKRQVLTVLSAVFMGSLSLAAAGTGIPALAATKDVAVTEYDEAALEKFKDNTLEYWEAPGTHRAV